MGPHIGASQNSTIRDAWGRSAAVLVTLGALWMGHASCSTDTQAEGPILNPVPDKKVQVGERLVFLVTVVPGTGEPPYEFLINADRPAGTEWVRVSDTSARFAWTPEANDVTSEGSEYQFQFTVQDGAGRTDSQEASVKVLPLSGPTFLNDPGYVLNLSQSSFLEFTVRVKDDAASHVDLVLDSAPEGAYLEQSGNKEAFFFWRPTAEQIALKPFWYVRLTATGYAPAAAGQAEVPLYTLKHDIPLVLITGQGPPAPDSCQEDRYAPNAIPSQAAPVLPAAYSDLISCPGADDWFSVGLNGNESLEVEVQSGGSGLVLEVLNPDGTPLCQSGQSTAARVTCQPTQPGVYTIGVQNAGQETLSYLMNLSIVPPAGPCQADRLEPDSSFEQATLLQEDLLTSLTLCQGDQDWFLLDLHAQQNLMVIVEPQVPDGNPALRLLDPGGELILVQSRSDSETSVLEYPVLTTGRYALHLEAEQPMTYSLLVWVE